MVKHKIEDRFRGSDMTPLIDLVFLLLMLFVIVSHFQATKANERVKLPRDLLAKPPEVKLKEELLLHIGFLRNQNGKPPLQEAVVFYAGEEIALDKIRERLESEKRRFQSQGSDTLLDDVTIIVRADTEVPTGWIQRLIHICRDVGFTKFSLKTTQDEIH